MIKVGLMGYGRAGRAVANVLASDPRYDLRWAMRPTSSANGHVEGHPAIPVAGMNDVDLENWFDIHPVDAIVDFSFADNVLRYGPSIRQRNIMLVSAISAYSPEHLAYLRELGQHTRVMSSPNITLGINFLLMAAKSLRTIAPFADVEVVEQHFREKPEVSGTMR